MGHRRQVHDLLGVGLGKHGETGLTAGHDVLVITEDVQGMGGQGPSGDVKDAGEQFACNFIHIGNHEQQALGSGIGGGEGAGGEGAVHRTGCTGLRLHFNHLDRIAKDILLTLGGPLVHVVGHGAGRGNRIDARDFGKGVGDPRRRVVGVH